MRKPRDPSPRLLGLVCIAPAGRLRVTCGALLPYFLTSLGTTAAVISLRTRQYCELNSTTVESSGGAQCSPLCYLIFYKSYIMYLNNHNPYLDGFFLYSKSQNIIRVNLLGNNFTNYYYIINFLFTYIPSLLASIPQYFL